MMSEMQIVEIGIGLGSVFSTIVAFVCIYYGTPMRSSGRWQFCGIYFLSFGFLIFMSLFGKLMIGGDWSTVALEQENIQIKLIVLLWIFNAIICGYIFSFCLAAPPD